MRQKINIAIDGPSSSGKSTIAKILAKQLDYIHINTGLMYRAIAWNVLHQQLNYENEATVLASFQISDIQLGTNEAVFFQKHTITKQVRDDQVSLVASKISSYESVRKLCVLAQQQLAQQQGVIMDGRDIASVVLPHAALKIFMIASLATRAQRRMEQNQALGFTEVYAKVFKAIQKRDYDDTHRQHSPLLQVPEAIVIDTTSLTIAEVVAQIIQLVKTSAS